MRTNWRRTLQMVACNMPLKESHPMIYPFDTSGSVCREDRRYEGTAFAGRGFLARRGAISWKQRPSAARCRIATRARPVRLRVLRAGSADRQRCRVRRPDERTEGDRGGAPRTGDRGVANPAGGISSRQSEFGEIAHPRPLLSLSNVYNEDELGPGRKARRGSPAATTSSSSPSRRPMVWRSP